MRDQDGSYRRKDCSHPSSVAARKVLAYIRTNYKFGEPLRLDYVEVEHLQSLLNGSPHQGKTMTLHATLKQLVDVGCLAFHYKKEGVGMSTITGVQQISWSMINPAVKNGHTHS